MSYDDNEYMEPEMNDYEDNFIPFNPRESYADNSTVASSLSENRKKQRKNNDAMKMIDKGYRKIKIQDGVATKEIDVYSTSDTPGTLIRDATLGSRYQEFRVGSIDEHQFFKTRMVCGTNNAEASTFFFDSPEQFERTFKTTVSPADKERWVSKCAQVRSINNSK